MAKASKSNDSPDRGEDQCEDQSEHSSHRVRLPGFITDAEIGLGDVIKRATSYVGIEPCRGCERRSAVLNRWVAFTGKAK